MRVLFVDDEPSVCELLGAFCKTLDIEYALANSAEEALRLCEKDKFTLVVTDLEMPKMNGIFLARELRKLYPEVGVFAFTGESGIFPRKDLETSFDQVFFKPSDFSRMIAQTLTYLAIKKYPFLK